MATVTHEIEPANGKPVGTAFPKYKIRQGTNFPVDGLHYDDTTSQKACWKVTGANYGSGNLTLDISWYTLTATSGTVTFEAQIAAVTPNTDTQDIETDALTTANSVTDTHLGTTAKRLHQATITISNLDSLAGGDDFWLVIGRNTADTMADVAILTKAVLSYSDT